MERRFKVETRTKCPICDGSKLIPKFVTYDDRYGLEDLYRCAECSTCRSFFLLDAIVPELNAELYFKYYPSITPPSSAQQSKKQSILGATKLKFIFLIRVISSFLQGNADIGIYVNKNEKALDVGCGTGRNAFIVNQIGGDWTGLEIDSKRCDDINKSGLKCLNGSIEDKKNDLKEKFDVILASQVIEHTFDPKQFIEACSIALRSGGRLILSTPNVDSRYRLYFNESWIHWHVPYHQTIFSINALEMLCKKYGLVLRKYKYTTPTTWMMYQSRYKKPLRGSKGEWYQKKFSIASILIYSFLARFKDMTQGNGDAIVAEFVKL